MTERGRDCVLRDERHLQIGPSAMHWQGDTLHIAIEEMGAPLPRRIHGTIRVTPYGLPSQSFALNPAGNHVWQPIAPRALVDVRLEQPDLRWRGQGYLDSNSGGEALEAGFQNWHWSRAHLSRDCLILYDALTRDGRQNAMALRVSQAGTVTQEVPPPSAPLPPSQWRVRRRTRADRGHCPRLLESLEDTPFYARGRVSSQIHGEQAEMFHESLDLDRFASPLVRAMLPFRMPRRVF